MNEMKSLHILSVKRWVINPYQEYSRTNIYLDWTTFLGGVEGGTKHQREYLLRAARELFRAMIIDSELRRGTLGALTIISLFTQFKTMVRWFASRDVWRFALIGPIDLEEYFRVRLSSGRDGGPSRKQSMQAHLHLASLMWELRDQYTSPLTFDPMSYHAIIALRDAGRKKGSWSPVAEDVALPLLKDALDWIQRHGRDVHSLCQYLVPARSYGVSAESTRRQVRNSLQTVERSPIGRAIVCELGMQNVCFKAVVEAAVRETLGAALFACLLLTGMRISELLSLRTSFDMGQPSDDDVPYRFITGRPAKSHQPSRKWVVPRIVYDILRLIQGINGDRWRAGGVQYVFLQRRKGSIIPPTTRIVGMMTRTSAVRYVKQFILSPARTGAHENADWFHPHRLRKTFARYVVVRNKSSLESLAYHYGHLYSAVLDGAYVGSDIGIAQLLSEENQRELRRCLTDIIASKNLGGKGGARIAGALANLDERFRGATTVESAVDALINEGVVVAPCDWGYCLYASDLSACQGDPTGPNPINRNPTTCGGCTNFVVTEEHRAWWERKYEGEELFLSRDDLPDQTRRVVEVRFRTTADVLGSLIVNGRKNGD